MYHRSINAYSEWENICGCTCHLVYLYVRIIFVSRLNLILVKKMESADKIASSQLDWLHNLPISDSVKEIAFATINSLDTKIEELTARVNGVSSQNRADVLNSNPAADTGGIRNQSSRQRQQADDKLFRNAQIAVKASAERDTLLTQRKRYIKDIKDRPIFEKALNTGKKSSGESYDRETMQFIKDELKLINDRISKVEFLVTTKKFKKL